MRLGIWMQTMWPKIILALLNKLHQCKCISQLMMKAKQSRLQIFHSEISRASYSIIVTNMAFNLTSFSIDWLFFFFSFFFFIQICFFIQKMLKWHWVSGKFYILNFQQLIWRSECAEKLSHVRECSSVLRALSTEPSTFPFPLLTSDYTLFQGHGAVHPF